MINDTSILEYWIRCKTSVRSPQRYRQLAEMLPMLSAAEHYRCFVMGEQVRFLHNPTGWMLFDSLVSNGFDAEVRGPLRRAHHVATLYIESLPYSIHNTDPRVVFDRFIEHAPHVERQRIWSMLDSGKGAYLCSSYIKAHALMRDLLSLRFVCSIVQEKVSV